MLKGEAMAAAALMGGFTSRSTLCSPAPWSDSSQTGGGPGRRTCDELHVTHGEERLAAAHKQPFVLLSSVGVDLLRTAQQAGKWSVFTHQRLAVSAN